MLTLLSRIREQSGSSLSKATNSCYFFTFCFTMSRACLELCVKYLIKPEFYLGLFKVHTLESTFKRVS